MTGGGTSQANLSREWVESATNLTTIQAIAPSGNKKIGEISSKGSTPLACVFDHDLLRRGMDRHQPRLAEFTSDDNQDAFDQVHVSDFQIQHLTDAETCD